LAAIDGFDGVKLDGAADYGMTGANGVLLDGSGAGQKLRL
jgi:hypothetical protein